MDVEVGQVWQEIVSNEHRQNDEVVYDTLQIVWEWEYRFNVMELQIKIFAHECKM